MNAGFATLNRPLPKLRDRFVAIHAEFRADAIRWHTTAALKRNVEQVLRLFIGAIDVIH
jgi:hypothetical protein